MNRFFSLVIACFLCSHAQAQWQATSGPDLTSEFISFDLERIAGNGSKIAAIIDGYGSPLSISVNDGYNWHHLSSDIQDENLQCLDYRDSTLVFGTISSGVKISYDHGNHFSDINDSLPSGGVVSNIAFCNNAIAASHHQGSTTQQRLYQFHLDSGYWVESTGFDPGRVNQISYDSGILYAGTDDGLFSSEDNGLTWSLLGLGNINIKVLYANGNRIFISDNTTAGHIYASTNGGTDWTDISGDFPEYWSKGFATMGSRVFATAAWEGIHYSDNNGTSWNTTGLLDCNESIHLYVHGDTLVSTCNNDGPSVSYDQGESWTRWTPAIGTEVYDMVVSQGNIVTLTDDGLYISPDQGDSWERDFTFPNCLGTADSALWMGTGSGLRKSLDNGQTWSSYPTSGPASNDAILDIVSLQELLVVGTEQDGVVISNDHGETWQYIGMDLPAGRIPVVAIQDSLIYASVDSAGLYVTDDQGASWTLTDLADETLHVSCLSVSGEVIYAGSPNTGMFRSMDQGVAWDQLDIGLSSLDSSINAIESWGCNVMTSIGRRGVYESTDCGNTWQHVNNGLINREVISLAKDQNFVYAGTNGGGVWRMESEQVIDSAPGSRLSRVNLYPNPSSGPVLVDLNGAKVKSIQILDIMGVVIQEGLPTTTDRLAINLPPVKGIYVIRMVDSEGYIESLKVVRK